VRADGWASATVLPTSHGSLTISDFLEQYHRSAVSRGLRPRSIAAIEKEFRRISAQVGARRLADLTPVSLQQWVESCRLKPDLRGPSSRTNVLAPPRLWKPGTGGRQARKEAQSGSRYASRLIQSKAL